MKYTNPTDSTTSSVLKGRIFSAGGACFIKKLREYHNISPLKLIKDAGLSLSLEELLNIENKGLEMDVNNFRKALRYLHSDLERFYILSDIYIELLTSRKNKDSENPANQN